jgi:spermidine/putrescine transport system substrate-binding protein
MTDPTRQPGFGAAFARGMSSPRMSRRGLLKGAGASVGTLTMAQILAACGGSDDAGGTGATATGDQVDFTAQPGPNVNFSNWPLYIDKAKNPDTGERYSPSLAEFEAATGIAVTYNDEINDNAQFLGELTPSLEAGQDTGRDIIVITNGRELNQILARGWATELDPVLRPNFDAHAADWAKDPSYDPGNRFTMAWQSGLTGIGYNKDLVLQPITNADQLMSTDYVPPGSVGLLQADAPDFAMIQLGIDPITSTPEDWKEAAAWLQMMVEAPTFRAAYTQGYVDDLTAGNLAATMGWSGDVLYYGIWEDYPFEFIVPEGGALLWIDNMLIPANSANPQGAYQMMDFYYDPEPAQMVTEWVLYMSPVPEVQELIAAHGEETGDEDLIATADNPFLWPDQTTLSNTSLGYSIQDDEAAAEWDATFNPIWGG